MAEKLHITGGDVIEVQLTSETVVMQTPEGRRTEATTPGHITNRMRLFVREDGGSEQKFDFEETELGVRETQRVAVVRGSVKRRPDPVNLILFNLSSGEKDCFEPGLRAYLGHKPFFNAPWKAGFLSIAVAGIYWLVSYYLYNQGPTTSAVYATIWAFLIFAPLWWICGLWDRVTERIRYANARKRFIRDMEGRVIAYGARSEAATAVKIEPTPQPQAAAQAEPTPPPQVDPPQQY